MEVSRAVSNIDLVAPYYIDILKGTEVHEEVFDGGTRLTIVNAPGSTVHLQFWEGVATGFQIKIDMILGILTVIFTHLRSLNAVYITYFCIF